MKEWNKNAKGAEDKIPRAKLAEFNIIVGIANGMIFGLMVWLILGLMVLTVYFLRYEYSWSQIRTKTISLFFKQSTEP